MNKATRILTWSLVFMFFLFWGFLSCAFPGKGDVDLEIKNENMSAELEEVSLRAIFEKLGREKGIWFQGDESVLEQKISVHFTDLPFQEGLKRILSTVNHALIFDEEKGLLGLFVFAKDESPSPLGRDEAPALQKGSSSTPLVDAKISVNPFKTSSNPFQLATGRTEPTETGKQENLPLLQESDTEATDAASIELLRQFENPFARATSLPSENPFGDNTVATFGDSFEEATTPPFENPFSKAISPSPQNPFEENLSPTHVNPFLNPFEQPQ